MSESEKDVCLVLVGERGERSGEEMGESEIQSVMSMSLDSSIALCSSSDDDDEEEEKEEEVIVSTKADVCKASCWWLNSMIDSCCGSSLRLNVPMFSTGRESETPST